MQVDPVDHERKKSTASRSAVLKQLVTQLSQSENRFRSLVQYGLDMIAILDEAGYYIYISPTVKQVLGNEPDFLLGKNAF